MDIFKIFGQVVVKTDDAVKQLRAIQAGAKAMADVLDESGNTAEKKSSKWGAAFKKIGSGAVAVGKTVATGLGVAATALGGLTAKALSSAGELEQNMGGSEAVFGKYADKIQGKAKEAFSNMGLSTSDYLATANKMGALFQGAGFDIEESMDLSSKSMQRAADVASIMGIDTASAMEAVAGAAKGNFTMMDNLGVAMNETTLANYALEKGMKKSYDQMTQQEKIGVAMEMFLDKTTYAAGNYAKENETLAGSLGTAKAALSNFISGAGSVDDVVSAFSNAADVIIKNIDKLFPKLMTGITQLVDKVCPMIPGLLKKVLPGLIEGATGLIRGLVSALPAVLQALLTAAPILLDGVVQVMNLLIESLPMVTQILCDALPSLLPQIITALVSLAVTLASNLPAIIIPIIQKLPEIAMSIITSLTENFQPLLGLFTNLETGMQILAVVIGTITAAIVANTIANKLKAIAVAAGAAAEGSATVTMGLHTIATNIATAATTAFGAAMSFLTSPITLVIAAIGLLIAIVVLCVKHWDKIKEAGAKAWEGIKNAWSKVSEWFSGLFEKVKSVFLKGFNWIKDNWKGLLLFIVNPVAGVFKLLYDNCEGFRNVVNNVVSAVKGFFSNLWSSIKATFANVKSWFSEKFQAAKNGIVNAFANIKEKLLAPFTKARDAIKNVADKIKGFFKGEISLPKIKMPHFSISPSGWKIGDLLKGSIPKLGIEWYAKAMNNPMLMTSPTVFGYNNATGNLMGGGEVPGGEVVSGANTLMNMIGNVVESKTSAQNERIIAILLKVLEAILGGNRDLLDAVLAGHVIKIGDREFGRMVRGYA